MNDPKVFENPCAICKKREGTQLCDYVIQYNNGVVFFRDWEQFQLANAAGHNETCDLPLCTECSKKVGSNADLCPHHYKLHLQAEVPPELRKAQARSKGKILVQAFE